ncbi:ATP-binding cassette domain-containing protein [Alloscardovia omnicolens]|uniref:ATP-binding cassette domain-containing protein n=1 Tax=Alloscardovia omnicolens TaxID=419015 RepID=UPI000669871F|nr:ATP-binding cassette domain-containing protein [Alloscardovia omnicolens]MDK6642972.1 ATP-binding cassette domain-containing protein [Alloscardovia omnicolens]PKY78964.1 ABC transporter ATP-binding protein [Alloscardovia omnicolens]
MSVQIKNLSVGLGNNQLLYNVNLDVADHERIGLIGASGSGKSLITKAILGTLPRSMRVEGQILIDGVNVLELSEHERAAMRGTYMTAVFQNPVAALNPVVSVRANVELPLTLHYNLSAAERLHRVQQALESVGLDSDLVSRYPSELSGGQAQRAAIAQAVVAHPQLLIADEPTTAVDSIVQKQIMDVLVERSDKQNLSVIFASHDFAVISRVAHRCYVINNGGVVDSGRLEELYESSVDYTRQLVEAARSIAVRGEGE